MSVSGSIGSIGVYHVPLGLQCIYGRSDEGGENEDGEEGRELRLPGFLYADDLVLCGESEDDLRDGGTFC